MGLNSSSFLLGVDIGTSSTKTCLFTDEGRLIASETQEYPINYPKPAWAEENPDDWLNATIKGIKVVIKSSKINSSDIIGISISGLTPNCVPIDANASPIRPALIWIDRRSEAECNWIRKEIGIDKCINICGNQIDPYFGGPKFLWFRKNEPKLFKKTKKILLGSNYVVYNFTDKKAVTDHSVAGLCAPCYDYNKKQWSEEICEAMQIPIELLPELHYSHEIIGEINSAAAKKTGLKKGTPIVTGGGDFACSTLGAAVIDEGEACAMYGTAGNILIPLKSPKYDIRLLNTSHVVKGKYLTLGSIFAGGILEWFRNMLGDIEQLRAKKKGLSVYQILDEQASKLPVGSNGLILLPYFMGERTPIWDVYARGVYMGITPYHTKAHLYRAILEGTGYALNHIIEIAVSQGISIREIIAVNGGAKSQLWRQIVSDIMGIPQIYISKAGGAPLGDAILAGIGCGVFQDVRVVKKWIFKGERTEPISKNHEIYKKYYKLFQKIYDSLKNSFLDLFKIIKNNSRN
ncbi:MAG: xylulokinase [Candidatus Helarchaeota archaeon]|nr:xylulokinase [Candidatus Helarchaeota archaeon]